MIKTIVVPVDRTEETKTALNIAVWLALLCEARVLLLGISHQEPKLAREIHPAHGDITISEIPDLFRKDFGELWTFPLHFREAAGVPVEEVTFNSDEEQDLEAYLSNLQKEITGSHLHHKLPPGRVSQRTGNGPLDQALKDLNMEEPIDLVVLPAHQKSMLRSLLFSSQPNQILRQDRLPVLVVPQGFRLSSLTQFENETLLANLRLFLKPTKGHLLVTLDGTATAEAALPLAAELAGKMNVSLYLLLVLPLDTRRISFDPETSHEFKADLDAVDHYDFAYNYLCQVQQDLIDRGINCHRIILQGKAEERIVKFIQRTRPILTILATHAYPRLGQILLGSVAEKVIQARSRLVLLVPPDFENPPEPPVEPTAENEDLVGTQQPG